LFPACRPPDPEARDPDCIVLPQTINDHRYGTTRSATRQSLFVRREALILRCRQNSGDRRHWSTPSPEHRIAALEFASRAVALWERAQNSAVPAPSFFGREAAIFPRRSLAGRPAMAAEHQNGPARSIKRSTPGYVPASASSTAPDASGSRVYGCFSCALACISARTSSALALMKSPIPATASRPAV
jgi:hypothetical protein